MGQIRLIPQNPGAHLPTLTLNPGESKVIGRASDADVQIDDISLSRRHLRLTMNSEGGVTAEDLGSTNGIFVNGRKHPMPRLTAGDRVTIGALDFMVDDGACSEPSHLPALPAWESLTRVAIASDVSGSFDRRALEGLLATSRELMAFTDLAVLLDNVLDRVADILTPDRSAILFYDAGTGALSARAVRPAGEYDSVSEFASATVVREAIAAKEAIVLVDVSADQRFHDASSIVRAGARGVICVPLLGRTGPVGALYADRLGAPGFAFDAIDYARAFAAHAAVALETAKLYADREADFRSMLEAFAKAIEARDRYTSGHSERVTAYAVALASAIGLDPAAREILRRGGRLHDIGKVGIPDGLLQKPGPLDRSERALVQGHATIGYEMLSGISFLRDALSTIRSHHERWDGGGYPDGLAGEGIHLHARLLAVADTYDAITSDRPYRLALSAEEAGQRIRAEAGAQFDPAAVDAFSRCERQLARIRKEMMR
ncbi:MAG: HD domain-containing protein [Acidobacteria bacterium]|nr:HD domain-containing protein [Acidobacteriota bacterium]